MYNKKTNDTTFGTTNLYVKQFRLFALPKNFPTELIPLAGTLSLTNGSLSEDQRRYVIYKTIRAFVGKHIKIAYFPCRRC